MNLFQNTKYKKPGQGNVRSVQRLWQSHFKEVREYDRIRRKLNCRCGSFVVKHRSYEDRNKKSYRGVGTMTANGNDFSLTSVNVVLDEFNREAIDNFLKANGFEVSNDWSRKIKEVMLIIEENQRGIRK